ncbi:MAG: hypothetical protein KDI98_00605 [Hyphomicrobiaceae bacterium]|nr:hypothetical protein [Hyphomicrobiaceae bacterium]
MRCSIALLAGAAGLVLMSVLPAGAQGAARGTVTGLPLPRFVSLEHGQTAVRVGPGENYPRAFTYQRRNLPVEVTAEFDVWRRVRDMDGEEGWVRQTQISGTRYAIIEPWSSGDPVPARARAEADSPVAVLLEPGVQAVLVECNGRMCLLSGDDGARWQGWVAQDRLWGAYPGETVER